MGQNRSNFDLKIKNATTERFVPVDDPVKLKAFYLRCDSIKAEVVLWTDNKKIVVKGKFKKLVSEKDQIFKVDFISDQKEMEAFKLLLDEPPEQVHLMIFFPKQVAFAVKAKILEIENGIFDLQTEGKLFRAQRRKDLRLTIPSAYSIQCRFKDPVEHPPEDDPDFDMETIMMNCDVYDISVGGVSFYVPPERQSDFPVGLKIKNFTFSIRSSVVAVDVTVRNGFPGEKGQIRVGCSFDKILEKDEDFLAFYITEHAMQVTSNFY